VICNLSQLDVLYTEGTVTQKSKVISSIFPEKLTFDGFQYELSVSMKQLILCALIDNKLKGKKMGQA
jgi:hypothetical protein